MEVGETLGLIFEWMTTNDDLEKSPAKDEVRTIVGEIIEYRLKPISTESSNVFVFERSRKDI